MRITSVPAKDLAPGTFARFFSESPTFEQDAAAAGGVKEALEAALRSYSALTLGERIPISLGGALHNISVVDVSATSKSARGSTRHLGKTSPSQ